MAKKRYYQSKKDRRDESRGMKEYYDKMDPRRRRELEDSMMISEDHSAMANLPQNVMMKEYPKAPYLVDGDMNLNDTIRGVDEQMWKDSHGRDLKKDKYPEKY